MTPTQRWYGFTPEEAAAADRWCSLGLRVLTANALVRERITTVWQLYERGETEIRRIPFIGRKGMQEISEAIGGWQSYAGIDGWE